MQALGAALFFVAAVGFGRVARRQHSEYAYWLELGAVMSALAWVNYALFPSIYTDWFYAGDVFRLAAYTLWLIGAAREVITYWQGMSRLAAAEERRRLAHDLHDGLAQELAFIATQSRSLASPTTPTLRTWPGPPNVRSTRPGVRSRLSRAWTPTACRLRSRPSWQEAALPRSLISRVIQEFHERDGGWHRKALPANARLSDREWEVAEALGEGLTTNEIAEALFIGDNTVRTHIASILRKLRVTTREEAVRVLQEVDE